MPVLTLEVMSDSSGAEPGPDTSSSDAPSNSTEPDAHNAATLLYLIKRNQSGGIPDSENSDDNRDQETASESPKVRNDLLEYMLRTDGSVVCKLCGEVLQSRTHWYRHKYKRHVIQPLNPSPLFQCEQCLVFFKSRKGYIGHIASRHSEDLTDPNPVVTKSEGEGETEKPSEPERAEVKQEPDADSATPQSTLSNTNTQYQAPTLRHTTNKNTESKKCCRGAKDHRSKEDWEEKRYQEEKLVADIIDRVKRECEAQGSGGGERRGYTRRTTVMHT